MGSAAKKTVVKKPTLKPGQRKIVRTQVTRPGANIRKHTDDVIFNPEHSKLKHEQGSSRIKEIFTYLALGTILLFSLGCASYLDKPQLAELGKTVILMFVGAVIALYFTPKNSS